MLGVINICERADRGVPEVLRGFSEAFHASLNEAATDAFALRLNASLEAIYNELRARVVYENDPPCTDLMQSFGVSMQRQATQGVFGDCGAFAVAVSALAARMGFGPGVWLLLGDEANPAQHIVNAFEIRGGSNIVIDATEPNGFGWQIPEFFTVIRAIDPFSGQELLP